MNAIRSWLYVGKRQATLNPHELSSRGISAVLQLAVPVPYSSIASLYLPVTDGAPLPGQYLREGIDFVLNARNCGQNVLIACNAGISRSAVFATATLRETEGLTLLDALRIVKARHADAQPHPILWESLCDYYQEEVSFGDMLDIVHGDP